MNQYLLLADYGNNEMDRHVLNGEDALLSLIEKQYLPNRSADLEVFVLNGAENPVTTNVADLLKMAEERQKRRKVVVSHLENLTRDMSPKFVIVVQGTRKDVAFGNSQIEAIQNFISTFVEANGEALSSDDALLVRKSLVVREYQGSSYNGEGLAEKPGDDILFDEAFAGLSVDGPALRR
jgi:cystathionine beta-lyase/cystathionine gamma-synthase